MFSLSIFSYGFMQRAFGVGMLLAVIVPCIGMVVVLRRQSMIGDALSHTSLAGVAIGLIFGFNPVLGAVAACIAAALGIEAIRKKLPGHAELSIAIIMSAGISLAGVLSGFVKNSANFNSFLFGSIVAISDFELGLVLIMSLLILSAFLVMNKELFLISLDEQAARLAGVPVRLVNFIFTLMTAVTVSIAARTVGALIVSSLMVIPVICAMQIGRSYKQTLMWSVGLALVFTITGLFLSYYAGLKPGATIVLAGILGLLIVLGVKSIVVRLRRRNSSIIPPQQPG